MCGIVERGIFATRAPRRPNPLGLSVVKLIRIEGKVVHFEGADMLSGTPLLDIKPYVPAFDRKWFVRTGWLRGKGRKVRTARADERFE